jgi:hypothetical protein
MARTDGEKQVIQHWLDAYNRAWTRSFTVSAWPDDSDSSKQNVDAIAEDSSEGAMAIEHTLLQPFTNERADAAHFREYAALLEGKPSLKLADSRVTAIFDVGAFAPFKKHDRTVVCDAFESWYRQASLPEGRSSHTVPALGLKVDIERVAIRDHSTFFVDRRMSAEAASAVVSVAVEKKLAKLLAVKANMHVLLLEKNAPARGDGEVSTALDGLVSSSPALKSINVARIDTVALDKGYAPCRVIWPPDARDRWDKAHGK